MVSGLSAEPNQKELPEDLANILAEQRIPINTLSLVVQEVNASEPMLAINTRTLRQPASLVKLFTTFIALDYLGPSYQWSTEIFASDKLINSPPIQADPSGNFSSTNCYPSIKTLMFYFKPILKNNFRLFKSSFS